MFYGFELSWFNSLCKDGWYWYRYLDKSSLRSCASIEEWSMLEIIVTSILIYIVDKVLEMLEEEDEDLKMPNKPYLYPQDLSSKDVGDDSTCRSWSSSSTSIIDSKETTSDVSHVICF
ncbi:hypothetical protein P8452_06706 [Trifolium repens]|nr:hypothetical protein P8452_06706 [Trifolium repens]